MLVLSLLLKLLFLVVSSVLFWIGGYDWLPARRIIMPAVVTGTCVLITHWWWGILLMFCPMCLTLSIGYGDNSWLRKWFGDGGGRGVWGLLVGLAASFGLFVGGHLDWWWFILYLAISGTLENLLKTLDQDIGDPIIGLAFASLIILVK